MISVEAARQVIFTQVKPLAPRKVSLRDAAGLCLLEDILAQYDIPAFRQSSMDGYAFAFSDWKPGRELLVGSGESAAGNEGLLNLHPGEALRIFTGAPLPAGADTVVMQEKVTRNGRKLLIEDIQLAAGANVRLQGAEIRQGELALPAGHLLNPPAQGFLAGIGVAEVKVLPRPAVHLIVTGRELQQPGYPLGPGQVYESNSVALSSALEKEGIRHIQVSRADDDLGVLTEILGHALESADLVLLSGGISVGDYDFVPEAAQRCGVQTLFHRVRQRPGRPLFMGMHGRTPVFGLPGNPASVLTCFYEYVVPALGLLQGKTHGLEILQAPLQSRFRKAAGLTHFLKAHYDGKGVRALDAQESFRLRSFARANCLIQVGEDVTECTEGSLQEIHLLPS
jgi:molybdopterin molybdotransferase